MTHAMQSLRSLYDQLRSWIAASAGKHEAEAARLKAQLAKQYGQEFKRGR